jgi:hypothetical protein
MRTVWLLCAVMLTAGMACAAVNIQLRSDPPLPVPNLFGNPGLEQGQDRPDVWACSASQPDVVDFRYEKQGGYKGAYLRVDARGSTSNGYLSQPLHVEPDTLYRVGIWLRLRGGTCVLWLHGYVDGKRYDERAYAHSLGSMPFIPDFVNLEWTDSPDPTKWAWLGREFRTWAGQGSINPHFGAFFDRGSMDLDEPFLGLARTRLIISVTGGPITQVVACNEAGQTVWDSGVLAPTQRFAHMVDDLPTDTRYLVKVTAADGTEVSQWYPEAK